MKQLLQSLKDGRTTLAEVPVPAASARTLVVETHASVISAGTERMLVEFGRANWLQKARSQPDRVRQVLDKVRTDGVGPTVEALRAKLDAPIALGYCQAGVVREVGSRVTGFHVGDRVVTNGSHAEFVRVTPTLAAHIPEGVSFEDAAFAPLGAIGLQGLRLAAPVLGETVVVYGLGLIGLLTVQLALASGCRVVGVDRSAERLAIAEQLGAQPISAEDPDALVRGVLAYTGGVGADAVLLTLAASSDEPVHLAAQMSRKRGRLVLVGVTGLSLQRDDFYKKELSFQVSCSYGPGRYDAAHEEQGIDYPLPYVRWTEARNFAAVLELMRQGRVTPAALITHRFELSEAERAYDIVAGREPSLGVVLGYPARDEPQPITRIVGLEANAAPPGGAARVAWLGAGNFSSRILIPAFRRAGATLEVLASSGGVSAATVGRQHGFRQASTDSASALATAGVDTVVVATRHDSHAAWTLRALEAGHHVFVEKPLALTEAEVDAIGDAARRAGRILCIGFNRRFAPDVVRVREAIAGRSGPLVVNITVNAGAIPRDHWTQDMDSGGGRIVGEACHFIDLARALVGAPICTLQVLSARRGADAIDDVALLQLAFDDGSIASVQYLANGDKSYPKERVELFHDGRVLRIDNFRRVESWGMKVGQRFAHAQDKGHAALAAAFVQAVRGGQPPIDLEELLEVSRWSVRAAALARRGGGSLGAHA